MSKEFNTVLMDVYNQFRDHPDPPIPLELIKEYLLDEGFQVGEQGIYGLSEHPGSKSIPFNKEKATVTTNGNNNENIYEIG